MHVGCNCQSIPEEFRGQTSIEVNSIKVTKSFKRFLPSLYSSGCTPQNGKDFRLWTIGKLSSLFVLFSQSAKALPNSSCSQ